MLGINLVFTKDEQNLIYESVSEYLQEASPGEKPFYQMTQNKIKSESVFVDGIYMRCMENSLMKKAQMNPSLFTQCTTLANEIQRKREHFQQNAIKILGA